MRPEHFIPSMLLMGTLFLTMARPAFPGEFPQEKQKTIAPARIKLFVDLQQTTVDLNFLKMEIPWVDWVRDREGANVHLLLTTEWNGGGGQRINLRFLGQEHFQGVDDTLNYSVSPMATPDDIRRGLANLMSLGLTRYAARLSCSSQFVVAMKNQGTSPARTNPEQDPWNFWVYNLGLSSNMYGESMSSQSFTGANVEALRVTDDRILRFNVNGSWNQNRYEYADGSTLRTSTESYNAMGVLAESISQHWTWGLLASGMRSKFSNIDSNARLAPAIEYNIWKYSESTHKQLTFLYQVGLQHSKYTEETIYGKTAQTLCDNSVTIAMDLNQPWGTVSTSLVGKAYLNDWSKNRLSFNAFMNVKLGKGFSVNVYGNYSRVRDQVALRKGDATPEEVLLRLQELQTNYRFNMSIGLSYTFGSIFNNVVNSRFRIF